MATTSGRTEFQVYRSSTGELILLAETKIAASRDANRLQVRPTPVCRLNEPDAADLRSSAEHHKTDEFFVSRRLIGASRASFRRQEEQAETLSSGLPSQTWSHGEPPSRYTHSLACARGVSEHHRADLGEPAEQARPILNNLSPRHNRTGVSSTKMLAKKDSSDKSDYHVKIKEFAPAYLCRYVSLAEDGRPASTCYSLNAHLVISQLADILVPGALDFHSRAHSPRPRIGYATNCETSDSSGCQVRSSV